MLGLAWRQRTINAGFGSIGPVCDLPITLESALCLSHLQEAITSFPVSSFHLMFSSFSHFASVLYSSAPRISGFCTILELVWRPLRTRKQLTMVGEQFAAGRTATKELEKGLRYRMQGQETKRHR